MNIERILLIMGNIILSCHCFGLTPIIKWAGGKERELPQIIENAPKEYDRYFEPFVGGGSVFVAMTAKEYFINDKSDELISLYMAIKTRDIKVFAALGAINESWKGMQAFVSSHMSELQVIYGRYRSGALSDLEVKDALCVFIRNNFAPLRSVLNGMDLDADQYKKELERNTVQKFKRMKKIESSRNIMPESDLEDNVRTAFMSSLYMYYRHLYNCRAKFLRPELDVALFVFIRNYAYSGMFRYNADGDFNVPYGGIGYNGKLLDKKLAYYQSAELVEHFNNATVECLDFEDFFRKHPPKDNDFIFLDPPYDSDFSTYAQNAFGKEDQERLASYLINECKGKWLMIIKNTPFIYALYNKPGIKIKAFDKKYQVSFMNRNDKDVEHLIITNY